MSRVLCYFLSLILIVSMLPIFTVTADAKSGYVGIEISPNEVVMKVGDKHSLRPMGYHIASVGEYKTRVFRDISKVTWKSSNSSIVKVSKKGEITAVKSGLCTISASYGKLKASCQVRVYTEKELYEHVLDADIAHEKIYMSLTSDYYKNYDLMYDTEIVKDIADMKVKAAKKVKEIIAKTIKKDMSDYDKMIALASWLIDNIELDDNYQSEFTQKWLHSSDKTYFYLDPLLYGKGSSHGLGLLFELLLNTCGIRCEYMLEGALYNTVDGDTRRVIDSNVVQLDGDFYYFNLIDLVMDANFYKSQNDRKYSIYDLLVSDSNVVNEFVSVTSPVDKERLYKIRYNPRFSYHDPLSPLVNIYSLGYNLKKPSKFDYYYYDFFKNSTVFVTYKESKVKGEEYHEFYLVSFPLYPDSTSSKYKKVMKSEVDMNTKIIDMASWTDEIQESLKEGYLFDSWEIASLGEDIASIEKEFEEKKDTFLDKKFVAFMKDKLIYMKEEYAKLKAIYETN